MLVANGVDVRVDSRDSWVPTPALSHAILTYNKGRALDDAGRADGIVVTPSHNPPRDGGFKYNPPNGGPADTDATGWVADRANELIAAGLEGVKRVRYADIDGDTLGDYDFRDAYVRDLGSIIDVEAIKRAGVRIGADPLGGASVEYWALIAEVYGLDLTVVNPDVDPTWRFMTLDWDEKIRMDPSSPSAMASLVARRSEYDILTGNDADADRHGIVTPDAGLMNPNHYLAVAIEYLFSHRPGWSPDAAVGKTLVSSMIIDRVAEGLGRRLLEVPVGFKWFVPGLLDGSVAFGGEESAGASFLRTDGTRLDDGQGRHPAVPACRRDPRGHREDPVAAVRRPRSPVRVVRVPAGRRAGDPGAEGPARASSPRRPSPRRNSPASRSSRSSRTRRATVPRSAGSRCRPSTRGSRRGRAAPRTSTSSTASPSGARRTCGRCRKRREPWSARRWAASVLLDRVGSDATVGLHYCSSLCNYLVAVSFHDLRRSRS